MAIERRIRAARVYEVQVGESVGPMRGAVIKREVEPTDEEREQMDAAVAAMNYIKREDEKFQRTIDAAQRAMEHIKSFDTN